MADPPATEPPEASGCVVAAADCCIAIG
jgi:hypothetical protein